MLSERGRVGVSDGSTCADTWEQPASQAPRLESQTFVEELNLIGSPEFVWRGGVRRQETWTRSGTVEVPQMTSREPLKEKQPEQKEAGVGA